MSWKRELIWKVPFCLAVTAAIAGIVYAVVPVMPVEQQKVECREEVRRLPMSVSEVVVRCLHSDHVMFRGNEEGSIWICLCDPIARRLKEDAGAAPEIGRLLP